MNIAEIILLILVLAGGYAGFRKGLLREIVAIIALVVGIIVGLVFIEQGKVFLSQFFDADSSVLSVFSFLLIFICVVALTTLLGKALKSTIDLTPIGYLDGAGGAILGVIKWMFFISVVLWLLDIAEISINAVAESRWYSKIKYVAPIVIEQFHNWFPAIEDFVKEVREFFESWKS